MMSSSSAAGPQRGRYVVLVDTYGASGSRLAPSFREAGYLPIRVQSSAVTPKVFLGQNDPFPYSVQVMHRGDLAETVRALRPYHPVAVVAGSEPGVELADALSEVFHPVTGSPTNGTAHSAARRDKYLMIEQIKQCDLRGAEQIRVESEAQLRDWHTALGRRVIVKPLRSAGNDGVTWCETPADSVAAFRRLNRRENVLSEPDDGVVAQEYLVGAEYLVNTVSRDGAHHVCDIWKTHRISANGVVDLMVACHLMPRHGEIQQRLVPYAEATLDALGIRHGPAHIEIKMTPDGPSLIEVGARLGGQDLPGYAHIATGESPIDWTVDAYVRPERFARRREQPYDLRRTVAWAHLVAPRSGTLIAYRGLAAIKGLDSFRDMHLSVAPGEHLTTTIDDSTYPIKVTLMHEVEEVLLRDLGTLRYLDGAGFYDVT